MIQDHFLKKLSIQILEKLPGLQAQLKMAPPFRGQLDAPNATTKQSAVLLLLYKKNNTWHTVFIQRTENKSVHSAQISLPGGKYDITDFSKTYTALRETFEEIGIPITNIHVLGQLTPLYIPPSNFMATCIVAYLNTAPVFNINKNEVQAVIEIPLHQLLNPNNKTIKTVNKSDDQSIVMQAPAYILKDTHFIWGATAMMLAEFEEIYKRCI
jgi:8-oxo-dGTP pyrophosphatase MutT (NUDIX family)